MLNVKINTYRGYEYGRRFPKVNELIDISNILGISIDYILKGNEEDNIYSFSSKKLEILENKITDNECLFLLEIYSDIRRYKCKEKHLKYLNNLIAVTLNYLNEGR